MQIQEHCAGSCFASPSLHHLFHLLFHLNKQYKKPFQIQRVVKMNRILENIQFKLPAQGFTLSKMAWSVCSTSWSLPTWLKVWICQGTVNKSLLNKLRIELINWKLFINMPYEELSHYEKFISQKPVCIFICTIISGSVWLNEWPVAKRKKNKLYCCNYWLQLNSEGSLKTMFCKSTQNQDTASTMDCIN